jgi:F-type H+-transporting ATPase subunit epsilon
LATLQVRVVSPAKVFFEGEAASVVAPAWDGKVGILPRHAPMIALLGAGPLSIDQPGGGSVEIHVAGGVLQVEDNRVTVLTEYAGDVAPDPDRIPTDMMRPEDIGDRMGNRLAKDKPLL